MQGYFCLAEIAEIAEIFIFPNYPLRSLCALCGSARGKTPLVQVGAG